MWISSLRFAICKTNTLPVLRRAGALQPAEQVAAVLQRALQDHRPWRLGRRALPGGLRGKGKKSFGRGREERRSGLAGARSKGEALLLGQSPLPGVSDHRLVDPEHGHSARQTDRLVLQARRRGLDLPDERGI